MDLSAVEILTGSNLVAIIFGAGSLWQRVRGLEIRLNERVRDIDRRLTRIERILNGRHDA